MSIGEGPGSTNQSRHTHVQDGVTVGFFTDPTVCIGCKACEVACKEWNDVPADNKPWDASSYDQSHALGASRWRHVKFLEQEARLGRQIAGSMGGFGSDSTDGRSGGATGGTGGEVTHSPGGDPVGAPPPGLGEDPFRWLFLSDVCKHCEKAGCLEACPTGSIVRTETGVVYVQDDICNGCGYCVVGCPFGVIDRRPESLPGGGGAFKCTFCYDRQKSGLTPACAKACPTESIQFGPLDDLRERASGRLIALRDRGYDDVSLYDPVDTSVKGIHAFFLVPGDPAAFGLPTRPEVPTVYQTRAWISAFLTSGVLVGTALTAFLLL